MREIENANVRTRRHSERAFRGLDFFSSKYTSVGVDQASYSSCPVAILAPSAMV